MIFYLVLIIGTAIITTIFSSIFHTFFNLDLWFTLIYPSIMVITIIAIDGLFAFIIRRLPNKWFDEKHTGFAATKKEASFYEKLQIKKWKDKVPELGGFTAFHKDKIDDPYNTEYLKRYILEANYGMLGHLFGAIFGFAIIAIPPYSSWYAINLPIAIVNCFLSLIPMLILRYNLRKLHVLYKFASRRAPKQ
jgi:hypothetical protein